ncbi:MAG TPA: UxaA family hydrolase [Chloroflexota bacterium]|nr:UxaA family hydrolase [Chloroflexota bacterium]
MQLHAEDNTATALADLAAGSRCRIMLGTTRKEVVLVQDVKYGHKFAVSAITPGEDVLKYGEVIGEASLAIAVGEHVHVHNVVSKRGRGDLSQGRSICSTGFVSSR